MYKVKGFGKFLYHARHHAIHQIVGLAFLAWISNIWDKNITFSYFLINIFASEIIDLDHVLFVFWYGKNSSYGKKVNSLLRKGRLIQTAKFLSENHKHLTAVLSHNIYICLFLISSAYWTNHNNLEISTLILGNSAIHLIVDMLDDIWTLRRLNINWFFPKRGIKIAKKMILSS